MVVDMSTKQSISTTQIIAPNDGKIVAQFNVAQAWDILVDTVGIRPSGTYGQNSQFITVEVDVPKGATIVATDSASLGAGAYFVEFA